MANYCPQCGEHVEAGDNFCPQCGEKLVERSSWREKKEKIRGFLGDRAADLFAKDSREEIEIDLRYIGIVAAVVVVAVTSLVVLWPGGGEEVVVEPLQIEQTSINGLDLNAETSVVGTAEIQLHNPNRIDAIVDQVTYELYINGNRAGEGSTDGQYLVPNSSTGNISFSLDVQAVPSLGSIGSYAWNQLIDQANQTLVNGRLNVTVDGQSLVTPFSRTVPS